MPPQTPPPFQTPAFNQAGEDMLDWMMEVQRRRRRTALAAAQGDADAGESGDDTISAGSGDDVGDDEKTESTGNAGAAESDHPVAAGQNRPSAAELAVRVYNETASLRPLSNGPGVDAVRLAIAHVILNRIERNVTGPVAPLKLSPQESAAIFDRKVPEAVAAFSSAMAAAKSALSRTAAPASGAASASFYNGRPTNATDPNQGTPDKPHPPYPFLETIGPYRNIAPGQYAPANSTYFAFFAKPRVAK